MRRRLLAFGTLAAAVVGTTAALLPGGTAGAISPPKAAISCDSRVSWINTGFTATAGWFAPNLPVKVNFLATYGSYVTATTLNVIPAIRTGTTVAATTAADGSITATGYGRGWRLSADLFYTETVQVTVSNSADAQLWQGQATCTRDLRTTVALTCDRSAHTVTAQVSGTSYDKPTPGRALRIEYTTETTSQPTADSPRFTGHNLNPPDFIHSATPAGTGTVADLGYVHTLRTDPDPYYYSEALTVVVRDAMSTVIVGRGAASCVYIDQGAR